jgi:D-arabinose 1-dehydrogenase-like Zn-dependent alcohol dehydrogenase
MHLYLNAMSSNDCFEGWLGLDVEGAAGNMVWGSSEPKKWEEDGVDIQVTRCSVCRTEIHKLRNGWDNTPSRESRLNIIINNYR